MLDQLDWNAWSALLMQWCVNCKLCYNNNITMRVNRMQIHCNAIRCNIPPYIECKQFNRKQNHFWCHALVPKCTVHLTHVYKIQFAVLSSHRQCNTPYLKGNTDCIARECKTHCNNSIEYKTMHCSLVNLSTICYALFSKQCNTSQKCCITSL